MAGAMANLLARMTATGVWTASLNPGLLLQSPKAADAQHCPAHRQPEDMHTWAQVIHSALQASGFQHNSLAHCHPLQKPPEQPATLGTSAAYDEVVCQNGSTAVPQRSAPHRIKPLPSGIYSDLLVLSGENTRVHFSSLIPMSMAIDILGSVPFFQCLLSWRYPNRTMARCTIWPLSAVAVSSWRQFASALEGCLRSKQPGTITWQMRLASRRRSKKQLTRALNWCADERQRLEDLVSRQSSSPHRPPPPNGRRADYRQSVVGYICAGLFLVMCHAPWFPPSCIDGIRRIEHCIAVAAVIAYRTRLTLSRWSFRSWSSSLDALVLRSTMNRLPVAAYVESLMSSRWPELPSCHPRRMICRTSRNLR